MKKYKSSELEFDYEQSPYYIDWYGTWLLDGPVGYEAWLQESLAWNLYDANDMEMSELPMYNKIWVEAEKQLTIEIDSIDFNKEKRK